MHHYLAVFAVTAWSCASAPPVPPSPWSPTADADNDGLADRFDACPAVAGPTEGEQLPGCPSATAGRAALERLFTFGPFRYGAKASGDEVADAFDPKGRLGPAKIQSNGIAVEGHFGAYAVNGFFTQFVVKSTEAARWLRDVSVDPVVGLLLERLITTRDTDPVLGPPDRIVDPGGSAEKRFYTVTGPEQQVAHVRMDSCHPGRRSRYCNIEVRWFHQPLWARSGPDAVARRAAEDRSPGHTPEEADAKQKAWAARVDIGPSERPKRTIDGYAALEVGLFRLPLRQGQRTTAAERARVFPDRDPVLGAAQRSTTAGAPQILYPERLRVTFDAQGRLTELTIFNIVAAEWLASHGADRDLMDIIRQRFGTKPRGYDPRERVRFDWPMDYLVRDYTTGWWAALRVRQHAGYEVSIRWPSEPERWASTADPRLADLLAAGFVADRGRARPDHEDVSVTTTPSGRLQKLVLRSEEGAEAAADALGTRGLALLAERFGPDELGAELGRPTGKVGKDRRAGWTYQDPQGRRMTLQHRGRKGRETLEVTWWKPDDFDPDDLEAYFLPGWVTWGSVALRVAEKKNAVCLEAFWRTYHDRRSPCPQLPRCGTFIDDFMRLLELAHPQPFTKVYFRPEIDRVNKAVAAYRGGMRELRAAGARLSSELGARLAAIDARVKAAERAAKDAKEAEKAAAERRRQFYLDERKRCGSPAVTSPQCYVVLGEVAAGRRVDTKACARPWERWLVTAITGGRRRLAYVERSLETEGPLRHAAVPSGAPDCFSFSRENRLASAFLNATADDSPYGLYMNVARLVGTLNELGLSGTAQSYQPLASRLAPPPAPIPTGGMSWKRAMEMFQAGMDAHFAGMSQRDAATRAHRSQESSVQQQQRWDREWRAGMGLRVE